MIYNPIYTYQNLIEAENQIEFVKQTARKGKGTFTFNAETQHLEFVYLGNNDDINEKGLNVELHAVVFKTLQPDLRYLNANNSGIKKMTIENCPNLKTLFLFGNGLETIEFKGSFPELELIDLSNNALGKIELSIENFPKLKHLYLAINQFTDLSNLARFFEMEDFEFTIDKNEKLQSPPPETVKEGKEAVINYYKNLLEQGKDYLYEAKMLVLGEGGAGKTSMVWRLKDENKKLPEKEETTRGISVVNWEFPYKTDQNTERNFRVNIWDFGGQQIYHSTHRFFLSRRALYIIVDCSREKPTDYSYWMNLVETFGEDSPVLLILNEKYDRKVIVENYLQLRGRFTGLKERIDVDLLHNKGRELMLDKIRHEITHLPEIGSVVPANWKKVRDKLALDKRNYISRQDYINLCSTCNLDEKDAEYLSRFFHELGVFLHFLSPDILRNTIFLKPEWVTNAVYKIIDSKLVKDNHGEFCKSDAANIWSDKAYEYIRPELLGLMKNFYLIYEINGKEKYIMPQHLNQEQPVYKYFEGECKNLTYIYDEFMPRGILHQFIVTMHKYINSQNEVWYSGVVLKDEDTYAEVIENYTSKNIVIRIKGSFPRDMMVIVKKAIDEINSSYTKLKVDSYISCNCEKCRTLPEPNRYAFKTLQDFLKERVPDIQCTISKTMVNVACLIDDVLDRRKIDLSNKEDFREVCEEHKRITELTSEERKEFHQALMAAYPSFSNLEMFMDFEFDVPIRTITSEDNLAKVVFDIIKWAIANGKIHDLIVKAAENSDNPLIQAFYAKIMKK